MASPTSSKRSAYDIAGDLPDENALTVQLELIANLANLFEQVLNMLGDVPIEQVDVIKTMRGLAKDLQWRNQQEEKQLAKTLRELHKARGRIKRRGEEKNLFAAIIEQKILEKSGRYKAQTKILREAKRVVEELERYESIVDVASTVQAGAYPVHGGQSGTFGRWFLTQFVA
jgi:hypothetical protein